MKGRVFIAGGISLLFSLVVIALHLVFSAQISASSNEIAASKSEIVTEECKNDLSDLGVVPGWLAPVLNWLPSDIHDSGTVAQVREGSKEEVGEGSASPEQSETLAKTKPVFPPEDIPPLYSSPKIDGEGAWIGEDMPTGVDGKPFIFKTVYRPSVEFPNTVVYMATFDMSRLKAELHIGRAEPGIYRVSQEPAATPLTKIVAITNAMWMQQHSKGGGAIVRGKVIYQMVPGMATMVVYQDDSVDILEWTKEIPLSIVKHARQLSHLILKNGMVVEQVMDNGKLTDSEIGLGGSLIDTNGASTMQRPCWFLANRTAFGSRDDGNIVFAMGHHVSTKDLARALALAGCKRAIHGDANIHNVVCNFYFRDEKDKIVKRDKLSPNQLDYTLQRYDRSYSKDFFVFYEK